MIANEPCSEHVSIASGGRLPRSGSTGWRRLVRLRQAAAPAIDDSVIYTGQRAAGAVAAGWWGAGWFVGGTVEQVGGTGERPDAVTARSSPLAAQGGRDQRDLDAMLQLVRAIPASLDAVCELRQAHQRLHQAGASHIAAVRVSHLVAPASSA